MRIFKWGNDLAVLLPTALVDRLGLNEGDELDIVAAAELHVVEASRDRIAVEKADKRAEFLRQLEQFRDPLPADYRFDRDEANER